MHDFSVSKIKVGISSCLLGNKVRFDGGHKQSKYCVQVLSHYFDFQTLCPEMAIGLGTPRKAIRLIRDEDRIRVVASDGSFDVTDKMEQYGQQTSPLLNHLSGYIFCAKSPSCGMERVTLYEKDSAQGNREGVGVFAAQIMNDHPLMPVEEDGRLNDPLLRENFITRVLAYHQWLCLVKNGITKAALINFHARHKYLLMAHYPALYYKLGPLLADSSRPLAEVSEQYINGFMAVLKHLPNRKGHTNTLQHLQGYFKRHLNSAQRVDLANQIDKYRQGLLPLMVPITLIKHFLTLYPDPYLEQQVYLNPHPEALKLRYSH
ncbi:MAG: DUF523 and DUF1722 domain-containing protein [Psychromonas sp.]|nr:DUF523 and DUF1722 domain-containing protein [Psychromonas sp.]